MLQLEINKLTEETNVMNARIEVEDQTQTLRSFLGINREVNLRVIADDEIPNFEIPMQEALHLAFENSPEPDTYERLRLESRSALASARANAGLKADLYVQFGLSQTGNKLADYLAPYPGLGTRQRTGTGGTLQCRLGKHTNRTENEGFRIECL